MTGQIFHHTNAPIDFSLVCFPKKLGGLGLINPEWMVTALNGRAIARMFAFSEGIGLAFKLQLLRELDRQSGCFFRLFQGAKWLNAHSTTRMPITGAPFCRRIYDTLISLKISVCDDWDKYTDAEILDLPYDLPLIAGQYSAMLVKRPHSSLHPLRIFC